MSWWLVVEFLASVAVGWCIEDARQVRMFRRALRQLHPPMANTAPPTTLELRRPAWTTPDDHA